MKAIRYARPDEIVQFQDEKKGWSISLKRYILPEPYPLTSIHAVRGQNRTGMVEVTLKRIKDSALMPRYSATIQLLSARRRPA